jgi:membrane protein involved in colicin uptake
MKGNGTRCANKIGGQKVQNYNKTVNKIIKPEIYLDDDYLNSLLKVLAINMYYYLYKAEQGRK